MFENEDSRYSGDQPENPQPKAVPRRRKDRNVIVLEKIETEGDRQLKTLAKKQVEVKTSLREHLSKRKAFTASTVYEAPTVSGHHTLREYQCLSLLQQRREELRAYHLDDEEIQLLLEHENAIEQEEPSPKKTKYGMNPHIVESRIQAIYGKIQAKDAELEKKDEFRGVRKLTRHEMDLERAISSRNKESSTLSNMLVGASKSVVDEDRPSGVSCMLKELERRVYAGQKSPRERLKDLDTDESSNRSISSADSLQTCEKCEEIRQMDRGVIGPLSRDEFQEFEYCEQCRPVNRSELRNQTASDQTRMETEDSVVNECAESIKKKVILTSESSIPEDVIKKYRLSVEEIKQIPRFKDYNPGEPNKTLYLKNLSNKVTEEDLPALFMRFQKPESPKIVFKLLKGRMRGQAFVSFSDAETAKEALELTNGYNFKDKPVIIQYAKKH